MKFSSKALGVAAAAFATAALAQTPAPTPPPATATPPAPAAAPMAQPAEFAVCGACHEVTPGQASVGPNLATVAGRKAGSTDYDYSPAMKASGITWTPDQLQAFIVNPSKVVPGTKMDFDGATDADAKVIVAYLASLKS
jgi:cytochrome c